MPRNRQSRNKKSKSKGLFGWFFRTKTGRRALAFANLAALALLVGWYFQQPPSRQQEIRVLVSNYLEREKDVQFTELAWDLWQYYYGDQFIESGYASDSTLVYAGIPDASGLEYPVRVLTNKGYLCGYADVMRNPAWVAYRMFDIESPSESSPRPDEFQTDERTFIKVKASDFTHSGFDRGHLAPNFGIARCYGPEAQLETFLMSNVIPQTHSLNAGPWKDLEMRSSVNYPARFQEVWVLTGPVFGQSPSRMKSGVPIPQACYKIMIDETEGKVRAQAFLFPQSADPNAPLESYLASVDDIEFMTGLDFFTALEDRAENALEAMAAKRIW